MSYEKYNDKEVIGLTEISFSYNGTPILEDVNLSVKTGDFFAILGPNGSAKSTLLKVMLGLLTPKAGTVRIFGQHARQFKDWHKIGYTSQQAANINTAFPATVEEVVSSGYYTGFRRLFDTAERKTAVKNALDAVGISSLSHCMIGELSGGQRQKVFLARAIVQKPEVLFLDEPTTGIDAASQQEFYELLSAFNKKGLTIIMITHDINAAVKRATKIGYMHDRNIILHLNNGDFSKEMMVVTIGRLKGANTDVHTQL